MSSALPFPPYAQLPDFLAEAETDDLVRWAIDNEGHFAPAMVRSGDSQVINADKRISLTTGKLGPNRVLLESRMRDALPMLMKRTGASGVPPDMLEIELAAHGDGAHYCPHTDLPIGATRARRNIQDDRVLSAVLYFYARPKRFSGGELRLFRLGVNPESAGDGDFVDIEPLHNSLVVFHSWVTHEVRPVSVPSQNFRDYRFAANIWFRKKVAAAS